MRRINSPRVASPTASVEVDRRPFALTYIRPDLYLGYVGAGASTSWEVLLHEEVERWFLDLAREDPDTAELVAAAIDRLAEDGPMLGRPLIDRIKGSRHHNMKELRPGSSGASEVRILFAFDPRRQALLLVAGDKRGSWSGWYDTNVPLADRRFDEHLKELGAEEGH